MTNAEIRGGYREALAETPGVPVSAERPIPGLGHDEYIIPRLWAIQAATRAMLGAEGIAEIEGLTNAFLTGGGDGPWHD